MAWRDRVFVTIADGNDPKLVDHMHQQVDNFRIKMACTSL